MNYVIETFKISKKSFRKMPLEISFMEDIKYR